MLAKKNPRITPRKRKQIGFTAVTTTGKLLQPNASLHDEPPHLLGVAAPE
jgi:hypothetical protein